MPDPDLAMTDLANSTEKWCAAARAFGEQRTVTGLRLDSLEARYGAVMDHVRSHDKRIAALEERCPT